MSSTISGLLGIASGLVFAWVWYRIEDRREDRLRRRQDEAIGRFALDPFDTQGHDWGVQVYHPLLGWTGPFIWYGNQQAAEHARAGYVGPHPVRLYHRTHGPTQEDT